MNKEIKMDTNNQNEQPAVLQATEAVPLEDHSLPADEVITAQQAESADCNPAPVFVP
jgi:hypothetical protein